MTDGPGALVMANKALKETINMQRYQEKLGVNRAQEGAVRREIKDVMAGLS